MTVEINNIVYQFTRGSDLNRNGMYLEACASNKPNEILLFAFYSDVNDGFTISAFKNDLPFELVENFMSAARELLPPEK